MGLVNFDHIDRADIPTELTPRHIAIVMDGNGRWAEERGMVRLSLIHI